MKSTVSGVLEDLKLNISEGYKQNFHENFNLGFNLLKEVFSKPFCKKLEDSFLLSPFLSLCFLVVI